MDSTSLENGVENIKMKGRSRSRSRSRSRTPSHAVDEPSLSLPLEAAEKPPHGPLYRVFTGIQPGGESGRTGFHPLQFLYIVWRSTSRVSRVCNVVWPVVPAAILVRYLRPELHLVIFVLDYLSMIPCANLIGFAGQELSRKLYKVWGVIFETTLGSVVEIIMFMVLCRNGQFQVIKAAILGSILATQLLCLGLCFVVGGMRYTELEFSEVIGEVGSDLLLTAGFGLIVPAAFYTAVTSSVNTPPADVEERVLHISRITSIMLIVAYAVYTYFQITTHESIYSGILSVEGEDRHEHAKKEKKARLTFTECVVALVLAVTLVTFIAISLVEGIEGLVEAHGISDSFVGLILVPLVEKFAEHLTAIDEAWNNDLNMALAHVLGATIQTSLFNGPLVVLVGWATSKAMDLNFDLFNVIVLILAILVVGNFLRDQKSNYLEGLLCVLIYVNIAVAAYYYPNPTASQPHTGNATRPHQIASTS